MPPAHSLLLFIIALVGYPSLSAGLNITTDTEDCTAGLVCRNGGRCTLQDTCICMAGFTGRDCDSVIRCPDAKQLLHNVHINQPEPAGIYGDFLTYRCQQNHQLPDVTHQDDFYLRTVRCNNDATWGPDFYDCEVLCPRIPTWRGYLVETARRNMGVSVRYDCYGFYPTYHPSAGELMYVFEGGDIGEQRTTCNETGEWMPPLYPCIEITEA